MADTPPTHAVDRPTAAAQLYLILVLMGFAAVWLLYGTPGIAGPGYPRNTFLFNPADRFADYTNMLTMTRGLDPYHAGSQSIYPPAANVFFYLFAELPSRLGLTLFLLTPAVLFVRAGWRWASRFSPGLRLVVLGACAFATEPFLICLDRGNLELWVLPLLVAFIEGYASKTARGREWGVLALAAAISFKVHPAILIFLYVLERRWLEAVKAVAYSLAITLLCASFLKGGIAGSIADFISGLSRANGAGGQWLFARFNTGLFDGLWLASGATEQTRAILAVAYPVLGIVVGGLTCLGLWRGRPPFPERFAALMALACLLPALSSDYRMIQLLPAALLLVQSPKVSPLRPLVAVLIAALMIAKNECILFPNQGTGDVGLGSILNPFLLLLLVMIVAGPGLRKAPAADVRPA